MRSAPPPSLSLALSASGLKNIPHREELDDFEFIVGDAHYRCPWFIADFLSPRIAHLHKIDNTICTYVIETKDPKSEFPGFLSLGRGGTIKMERGSLSFYDSLSEELENAELSAIVCERRNDPITASNVFWRLRRRFNFHFDISKEVEFIASHFHQVDTSELKKFDVGILSEILSSKLLKIKSEDWLCDLIWSLVETDQINFTLFQFVSFEFVSVDVARQFIETGSEFVGLIDASIWSSVGRRFIQVPSPKSLNSRLAICGKEILPVGKSSLDGIISYLTTKHGGNVHDKGVIEATASSALSAYPVKNVADLQNGTDASHFESRNEPNSWLCYDFKNMRITPTHYSILTYPAACNHHPKSWCLEVSTNGQQWAEVHQCTDNDELNGANRVRTWQVAKPVESRFVRLRQTGKNHYNHDYLLLCGLELFGTLNEP
jgi:hypothetical protein